MTRKDRAYRLLGLGVTLALKATVASTMAYAEQPATAAWLQVIDAAKKEGMVTLYSSQALSNLNDLASGFKKEYGIAVQIVRALQSELQPRVDIEFESGRGIGDVFVSSEYPIVADRHNKGYMLPVLGPAFDDPAYNKTAHVPAGTYFQVSAAILTFSWNTELYPKGIKDYPDIFDPSLIGKIGTAQPTTLAQVDFYLYLDENYGPGFVEKLGAMKPRLYPGALPMAQAVVSGEISVGLMTQPLVDEKSKGAPVDWGFASKSWGSIFYGHVLKRAPHPNAAQLLANYMVTRPGQEALARKVGSVLPNVNGAIGDTSTVRVPDWPKLTTEFYQSYMEKWRGLFLGR